GAWRLDAVRRPHWPDTGLKTSRVIGNRDAALAALVEEPALAAAVDALLAGRPYERPAPNRRPQVLFTLPNAQNWTVPTGWDADSLEHRADLLDRTGTVGDVPLSIVEMTGVPGDVWLMDLRVLHVGAPNAAGRPRMMLTFRYERSDLLPEVAEAYGWR